jgi:hypothetical protein
MSLQIAPMLIDAEVARLRAAPCERCQREVQIEAHIAYGEDKVRAHICCKRCGARAQLEAIGEVASAAVEDFPASLPDALRAIPMNLYGLAIRFRSRAPSEALRQAAAERVAAAQQEREREARIQRLAAAMPPRNTHERNHADATTPQGAPAQQGTTSAGEHMAAQDDLPKP